MPPSRLESLRPGETLVVEAATAERALQEVADRLGDGAEILSAERVRRGGVGGFFAKEAYQLTVRVPDGLSGGFSGGVTVAPPAADGRVGPTGGDAGEDAGGIEAVLRRLTTEVEEREGGFEAALRRHLVQAPAQRAAHVARAAQQGRVADRTPSAPGDTIAEEAHAPPEAPPGAFPEAPPAQTAQAPEQASAPAEAAEGPAQLGRRIAWVRDPAAAPGTGPVRWSAGSLDRLGLPAALTHAVEAQQPVDDQEWLLAVAAAVAPYCRPLPGGDALLVGPKAARIGQPLGLATVKRPQLPPEDGTVCLPLRDTLQCRDWLAGARNGRWLHLVVGGAGWHGWLFDEPLVVSWAGLESLPAALSQCAAFGLVLGYGAASASGGGVVRANPVDVALSVRSLLPRR